MHRVMLCFGICVEKPSSAVIFQNSVLHLYNEYVENMLKSSSNPQVEGCG